MDPCCGIKFCCRFSSYLIPAERQNLTMSTLPGLLLTDFISNYKMSGECCHFLEPFCSVEKKFTAANVLHRTIFPRPFILMTSIKHGGNHVPYHPSPSRN